LRWQLDDGTQRARTYVVALEADVALNPAVLPRFFLFVSERGLTVEDAPPRFPFFRVRARMESSR
jgi:hypothetical protein